MNRLHKRTACFLASFMLIFAASVAAQPPHLRVAVASPPKTLDPALATDAAGARLLQLTNPALLEWDATYQPRGLVARGCMQDGRTVTCTIPSGFRFHDGTPLNATELQGWFTFLKATPRSPLSGVLHEVEEVTAPSPDKLVFQLAKPSLSFLGTLVAVPLAPSPTTPEVGILRPGVGPYRLVEEDTLGNVILRKADKAANGPQKLTFINISDPTTRLLKLKQGEVDVVYNDLPPELYRWAAKQGFPHTSAPSSSYSYLAVNFNNPHLGRLAIRKGLNESFNKAAIRTQLLGGLADPATTILPVTHPAAWQVPEAAFDPFVAPRLLDAADTFGDAFNPRFTLTLLISTDALSQRVAQVLQQQAAEAGIGLQLRPMEWGAFYEAVKSGRFDLALMSWVGEQPPEFYSYVFDSKMTPPAGLNRGNVNIPVLDAAIDRMMAAPDLESHYAAAITVQKIAAETLPYIPLYRRHHVLVAAKGMHGCAIPLHGGYQGLLACEK